MATTYPYPNSPLPKPASLNKLPSLDLSVARFIEERLEKVSKHLAEEKVVYVLGSRSSCKNLYDLLGCEKGGKENPVTKAGELHGKIVLIESFKTQAPYDEYLIPLDELLGKCLDIFDTEEKTRQYNTYLDKGKSSVSDSKLQKFAQLRDKELRDELRKKRSKNFNLDSLYDACVKLVLGTNDFNKDEAKYLVYEYLFIALKDMFDEAEKERSTAEAERIETDKLPQQNKGKLAELNEKIKAVEKEKEATAKEKSEAAKVKKHYDEVLVPAAKKSVEDAKKYMWTAIVASAATVIIAVPVTFWSIGSIAIANRKVSQCDERIVVAQTEADKKVKDAEQNAANQIAKIETDTNKKVADAKTASEEAIQSANDNANKKITEHKQKIDEEHAKKVTAVEKRENDANTKIDKADKLEKSLKQKIEKQEELTKQSEEQIRQNKEKEKELSDAIKTQQEETAAAVQSKKNYEDYLKAADVDIAELSNFKENFNTIRNGYWHWTGNNQQIPVLGAAKIIERHGGTLVLEDNGNGSTREKRRFNVLIEQLTKEQKALVELLKPNKRQ